MKRHWPEAALILPGLLGLALSVRYAGVNAAPGETGSAALDLLRHGVIGDPYGLATGPTAHVSPLHAGYLAAIFWLCGGNTQGARLVLGIVCTLAYLAGATGVLVFARRQRLGQQALWLAVLLLCLLPVQLPLIVISARQWDQPFAALLLLGSLLICTDPALRAQRAFRPEAMLACLAGLAGLVSPSVMPAILLGAARVCVLRSGWRRSWRPGLLCALIVAVFLVPWAVRNRIELGGFVLTRSNAPLELATGNEDGATGRSDHVSAVHPHDSPQAAAHLKTIGELRYMAEMRARATGWIKAHPARFASLTLTRLRLLFFPDPSMAGWDPPFPVLLVAGLLWAVSLARFWAAFTVPRSWGEAVIWWGHAFLPLAPYAITHVSLRYAYPVFFPGLCLILAALPRTMQGKAARVSPGIVTPARDRMGDDAVRANSSGAAPSPIAAPMAL